MNVNVSDETRPDVLSKKHSLTYIHWLIPTYINKDIDHVYFIHKKQKKWCIYDAQVEKGNFASTVILTSGGMESEAKRFYKRLANLFAGKINENYSNEIHKDHTLRACLRG